MLKILSEGIPRGDATLWLQSTGGPRPWSANGSGMTFIARRWLLLGIVGALLLATAAVSAARIGRTRVLEEVRHEAQTTANLHAAVLRIELEKYRSVPFVMGSDAEVRRALEDRSPERSRSLDHKLAMLSKEVRVKVIYVLDATSFGIADSNLVRPASGNRLCYSTCNDRYYYTEAMRSGRAELFALGRADQLPGLYISHAIDTPQGRIGVAVVKVAFDKLEQEWGQGREPTFVTDRNGVVIISSVPQWRLTTLGRMSETVKAELAATGQFGPKPLTPLPLSLGASGLATAAPGLDGKTQSFIVASTPLAGEEGWTLHLMKPTSPTLEAGQFAAGTIAFLCGLLALVTAAIFLRRDDLRRAEAERQILARQELEARVASRTSELSAANRRLTEEMEERRRMAETLHVMQDELVQANKLATLGQIAAGVAHEINQPVAAIKTYARNAGKYLGKDQTAQVSKNLGIIGDLTDRIAVITSELRAFARRSGGGAGPAPVGKAIDGALLLVSYRLKNEGVRLIRKEQPGLMVMAERVRLEQVLVNLLQNALDACGPQGDGVIELTVEASGDKVRIIVCDNGPGLSKSALGSLFMPFVTSKLKGLGLGLVISRDIIAEFGGDLTVGPAASGACFVVTLNPAG